LINNRLIDNRLIDKARISRLAERRAARFARACRLPPNWHCESPTMK